MTGIAFGYGSGPGEGKSMREITIRVPRVREEEAESSILIHRHDTEDRPVFDYYLEQPEGQEESVFHLFTSESDTAALLSFVQTHGAVFGEASVREVKEGEWAVYCAEYLEPYWLAENLLVDPFAKTEKEILLIRIVCGKAFGIGDHSTTRLAAQLLQKHLKRGQRVLDVGCGTGILSILASKLGAGSVIGFDIDPDAVWEAERNARENRCDPAPIFRQGDYCDASEKIPFEVFVSNIYAEVLEEVVKSSLKSVGVGDVTEKVYILTGILEDKWDRFDEKMKERGFRLVEKRSEGPWAAGVWIMKPGGSASNT